jgi:hypothetical protein
MNIIRVELAPEFRGEDVVLLAMDGAGATTFLTGHESMTTSQHYVTAAGIETRSAAARNPLYNVVSQRQELNQRQAEYEYGTSVFGIRGEIRKFGFTSVTRG